VVRSRILLVLERNHMTLYDDYNNLLVSENE
jgi:hypothetical protein